MIEAEDADFTALIEGRAPRSLRLAQSDVATPDVLEMLKALASRIRPHFAPAAWLVVEAGEIVGLCSIVKPPLGDGAIEIGYGIATGRQRRGIARRAIAAVLDWARGDPRVSAVTADTSASNSASQSVLENNGFIRVGTRTDDDDGELICWKAVTAG